MSAPIIGLLAGSWDVAGIHSFVREPGDGDCVLSMHGVPACVSCTAR